MRAGARTGLIGGIAAVSLASPVAQARFLQVDPVGYKDQVNLYEYVNDDPVDGRDPSGLTYTQSGPNGSGVCTIDKVVDVVKGKAVERNATSADHKKYAAVEKSLTLAYNKTLASGKTEHVSVRAAGATYSFSISAKSIAQEGAARQIDAYPALPGGGAMASFGGVTYVGQAGINPGTTKFGGPDRTRQVEFDHEFIHGSREEARGFGFALPDIGVEPLRSAHQDPYNNAANDIIGPR